MNIRNFCIIAHVDHGKSTLADRFLEICHTVPADKMKPQLLDSLALERERGITIKLAPVRLQYTLNSEFYILNLIDTPGHVDFSYEVSRTLAAVEGTILLVDATAGIQAQTLAHGLAAMEQNLTLIPVINKIDLPNADIENTKKQLVETFGFNEQEILLVSAKSGEGVEKLLEIIIKKVPPPKVDPSALRALVFDSFYDPFKGVVAEVRIISGQTPPVNTPVYFLQTKARGYILETGYFAPQLTQNENLQSGEIGYIATGIKIPDLVRVGDTISTDLEVSPLQGYREVKPMVFVGLYPIDQDEYQDIKDALQKFKLNDPSFSFEPEHSQALGSGFRCGFLGLLHAEVVQERLSSEFNVDLLATAPSVEYLVNGKKLDNPSEFDEMAKDIKEPWVNLKIFVPQNYLGNVMELVQDKRGIFKNMQHFGMQAELLYEMPLSEMITDFYDKLKSVSSGFASLDWKFLEFREVDAVKVDILVGGEKVDALSQIIVKEKAESVGRRMVEKLKQVLPRQNFAIAIQAAIG
ncbi:elongation factor 4, partial [Candidatus Daviesbacteria bacterium]|nr:elongation factor 4 [Candidatus Daviesbacteria bacterium]